jgi:ribosome maturation factor RimP
MERGRKSPLFVNKMISKSRILELAEERIAERDPALYVVEINVSAGNNISVEIDRESGSVSIDDCVSISRNIEHNLDREEEDFALEVSSAGIDQPLRVVKQFIKNIGRPVKVKTLEKGTFEGVLAAADQNGIVLETKEKRRIEGRKKKETVIEKLPFKYNELKETKLVISF